MIDYPKLKNAPIEEAIIGLVIDGKNLDNSMDSIRMICSKLEKNYPTCEDWIAGEISFNINDAELNTSHKKDQRGSVLKSNDEKSIVHIGKDTLALHRLKPYISWLDFESDYKYVWNLFEKGIKVQKIKNILIRYINKFTIPIDGWDQRLLMHPNIQCRNECDDSVISIGGFFSKYILFSDRHSAKAVTLLDLKVINNVDLEVVMDIEVQDIADNISYSGYSTVTDTLNRLRAFKNHIFFSNLPNAEELFR
ncbi:MAG: TIGR04255 family protein [Endozoicomonadaceae bacterium]|nr:TIGR04255 family protein [Endozoicomonadaceae bacterium]